MASLAPLSQLFLNNKFLRSVNKLNAAILISIGLCDVLQLFRTPKIQEIFQIVMLLKLGVDLVRDRCWSTFPSKSLEKSAVLVLVSVTFRS